MQASSGATDRTTRNASMNHGVLRMISLKSRSSPWAMGCSFTARPKEAIGIRLCQKRPTNVIDFIKYYVNININFGWHDVDALDVPSTIQVQPRRIVKAASEPSDGDSRVVRECRGSRSVFGSA